MWQEATTQLNRAFRKTIGKPMVLGKAHLEQSQREEKVTQKSLQTFEAKCLGSVRDCHVLLFESCSSI